MKKIHLYTLSQCPFCVAAKAFLEEKKWDYTETVVDNSPDLWKEMMEKSGGGNTAPQIFFGDVCIGGFSEMTALEESGELDKLAS
jgi:glutaredoxin 3